MIDSTNILRFGEFELDIANRQLRRAGAAIDLGSRYFDALLLLVSEAGSLVSKTRFMDEVWRGIPVTDEALTQCIRTLRRALGDDAANPRFIATVPKHGYRFLVLPEGGEDPIPQPVAAARWSGDMPGAIAGATTLAGGVAGALGGMFYGLAGTAGGAAVVPVLAAMVAALGILGGAGVGLGLATARVMRPQVAALLVAGGAVGGMAVGALGNLLGQDGLGLLTGQRIGPVTGVFEGLVLGTGAGLAAWLIMTRLDPRPAARLLGISACIGGCAGLFLHAAGGRLLGGSLLLVQQLLPDTQLALGRVATLFGEQEFGARSHAISAIIEGAVFTAAIGAALLLLKRR
ncbi:winged helix-turn-helix domain-containing protein [Qipengyuania marisflavi]|uniref:Transcriptional regulator n=1 Tax=Qipengyuania marisflavi TaxID=2486356 RepID=A0A5S3P1U7_9SPHN|nr:transcriptional regulator [Qipengyuania marisflavi]TMM45861.1 transcriptional regulator [Qipengyuania marisflavi]